MGPELATSSALLLEGNIKILFSQILYQALCFLKLLFGLFLGIKVLLTSSLQIRHIYD